MCRFVIATVAVAAAVVSAHALSGDLVVLSDRAVQPNDAAGLYYLGKCSAGYIYNGSAATLGAVSPYRVLDEGARAKHYFLLTPPERTALTAADMAAAGSVQPLGDEYLLGVARASSVGLLLALEPRLGVRELRPGARVPWKAAAEAPPTKKNATVEAAINTITGEDYAGYIAKLQSYRTRYSFTPGAEGARNWLRNWYAAQNLDADWHAFECGYYESAHYPEAGGSVYLDDRHCLVRRSRDGGASWDTLRPARATAGYYKSPSCYWFDDDNGIFAGIDGYVALTADGGDSWEFVKYHSISAGGFISVRGLDFAPSGIGWLSYIAAERIGNQGPLTRYYHVLKTVDGGRSWNEVEWNMLLPGFDRLATYDERRMWALRYNATAGTYFYYSGDGGGNWAACSLPVGSGSYVYDAAAVGPREAWGGTSAGHVVRTTNGVDWQDVDTGYTGIFLQVEFPTPDIGYIAGTPVIKTEDGGETWTPLAGLPEFMCFNMSFADAEHGVIADRYGENVYLTEDGGETWTDISGGLNAPEYNVVAERRGTERPDEIVIIGGHYDSISEARPWNCPGADDNASGAAVAMAAARAFRNVSFERTVRFMGFGDEEAGCLGSEAYANECAEKGENIIAVLNADMVAYDEEEGGRDDFITDVGEYGWLAEYLIAVGAMYGNNLIYESGTSGSDHLSFRDAGYAAMGTGEGGVGEGGSQENPWYHSTEDTLDKLDADLAARCARDLAAMVAHLAGEAGTFPDPPGPGEAAVPFARAFAVYPNPYCYASTASAGVRFVGLSTPAKVEIYDLAGRRVARWDVAAGTDEYSWRPATAGGAALAAGVYLYHVSGEGQEETGKIAVIK
ncbi:MAG: M20/M25/M40 family metallo-hydrolase [Candidatus Zixiibacteriota bacterium]|jgi:photosystem II stability/assembly factor-like uncharacterized protein